jgi:hypothetical protein
MKTQQRNATSLHTANPEHEVAYQDLCELLNKHAESLSPLELLAIAGNMVGKLIALQDQRTVTPEMAMTVVRQNIEQGNQQVLAMLAARPGETRQ